MIRNAIVSHPADPKSFLKKVDRLASDILKEEEFVTFTEMPGYLRQVIINNFRDPKKFLRTFKFTVEEILQEEEFAEFNETPGVILSEERSYSDHREF